MKMRIYLYNVIHNNIDYRPNDLSPLKRLSSWMYSLDVLNFKSNDSNSMYSSPFLVTGLPFMSIDTFNPAKMSSRYSEEVYWFKTFKYNLTQRVLYNT